MKNNSKVAQGFTLIELLVVVAILGILLAMLGSALSKAKGRARSAQCQSNLKEIGLAVRMYLGETGSWPISPFTLESFSAKFTSADYHGPPTNRSIWYCPSWQDDNQQDRRGTYMINDDGSGTVHWDNANLINNPVGLGRGRGEMTARREGEVVNPADMIVFAEMSQIEVEFGPLPDAEYFPFNHPNGYLFVFRHNRRANSLFGDGHVEPAHRDELIGKDDSIRRRWNYDNKPHNENWR